jgi:glycosyltransferase involved in cell wall biosynthesis
LAAGTPVISYKDGGALDYVKENKTGLLFENQTIDSLAETLKKLDSSKFSAATITKSTTKFSVGNFTNNIRAYIKSLN